MTIAATTLGTAVAEATAILRTAGLEQPALDARLLVQHALALDAIAIFTMGERRLGDDDRGAIDRALCRRLAREPVSRIVGARWFYGRPFKLGPATLDPRPDSETLIDHVLGFAAAHRLTHAPLRILDVGTGTGCLLTTLLSELPRATGVGVDLSAEALAVAAGNANALGIPSERVAWVQASGADPAQGRFDVIVANPPYIPTAEIDGLAPEVRSFDPRLALDGGKDGLDCYREWLPPLWEALEPSQSMLVLEVGIGQAAAVSDLLRAVAGVRRHAITVARDLGDIERSVSIVVRS